MTSSEPSKVHPRSEAGFGAGNSELYDIARPSYVPEALLHVLKALHGKSELKIVEIGCGGGILTRALLAHPEWNRAIAEMRCIEPNEGMRTVFSKTVNDSRVSLSNGTFDTTGVPYNWADVIVIASAIHWCLHLEATVKEFSRILKSDGVVCFLSNPVDKTRAAWVEQIDDICMPKQKGTSSSPEEYYKWRQIFDMPVYKQNFAAPEETTITYTEPETLDTTIARYMTWSGIAPLPDEEKEAIKEQIKVIVQRGNGLVWLDENRAVFEVPFVTPIVLFRRVPRQGFEIKSRQPQRSQ